MSADAQPWSPRRRLEATIDPDKILHGLGWEAPASKTPPQAPGAEGDAAGNDLIFCSFCWTALVPEAEECADCGRSVADMEASRASALEADGRWLPPSKGGQRSTQNAGGRRVKRWEPPARAAAPAVEPPPPPSPAPALAPPVVIPVEPESYEIELDETGEPVMTAAAPARKKGSAGPAAEPMARAVRYAVAGIAAVVLIAGAGAGGFWVALHLSPKPKPTSQAIGKDGQPLGAGLLATGVRVEFRNPYPELRLLLCNQDGKVLLSSSDVPAQSDTRIEPGEYRLGIIEDQARWRGPVRTVTATAGEALQLAPPGDVAADYYLWLGKKLHAAGDGVEAELAWRKAIKASPAANEARLQLAAYRAVHFDYREAKSLVKQVLQRSPGHPQAARLLATLEKLEARR